MISQKDYIKIYDELADDIFSYCYLRLPEREKAKELLQKVFMKVWEGVKAKKIINVKMHLYKTANHLIQETRSKNIHRLTIYSYNGFIRL